MHRTERRTYGGGRYVFAPSIFHIFSWTCSCCYFAPAICPAPAIVLAPATWEGVIVTEPLAPGHGGVVVGVEGGQGPEGSVVRGQRLGRRGWNWGWRAARGHSKL